MLNSTGVTGVSFSGVFLAGVLLANLPFPGVFFTCDSFGLLFFVALLSCRPLKMRLSVAIFLTRVLQAVLVGVADLRFFGEAGLLIGDTLGRILGVRASWALRFNLGVRGSSLRFDLVFLLGVLGSHSLSGVLLLNLGDILMDDATGIRGEERVEVSRLF